jgi:hypothetical protein
MLDGFESTQTRGGLVLLVYACLFTANSWSRFAFIYFYHALYWIIGYGYML